MAVLLAVLAGVSISAHRRDEYLQAARIDIGPRSVQIELDLTPGIAVAPAVISEIDRDRSGAVSAEEARAYAARVLDDLTAGIDGQPIALALTGTQVPSVDAMLKGEGTIRLQMAAPVASLALGSHHFSYRNVHRADIGVYLANALVPSSNQIDVVAQQRDVDQRELVIDYRVHDAVETTLWSRVLMLFAGMVITTAILWRLRSVNASADPSN